MSKRNKPASTAMPNLTDAYDAMSAAGVTNCRGASAFATATPSAPSEHVEKGDDANDDWSLYEKLDKFRTWACDPFTHTNGSRYRYAVVSRTPFPGLGWVCLVFTLPLPGEMPRVIDESRGAFYDDSPDHPEGAIAWAVASARAKKVREYDSVDMDEWRARVFERSKAKALPDGDPGVLDEPWKETLISLGYTPDEAHVLALRPTPAPLSPDLPGKLASIRVLWRQPDTLCLWGIPYDMRADVGQTPNHLWRAREAHVPPKPGHIGSKQVDLSDWIWLGSPGWWGNKSRADIDAIKAWLALSHVKQAIPSGPCEWSYIDPAPTASTKGSDR